MKSLLTFALLCFGTLVFSQGINFVAEDMAWKDVLAKAKAENKIVFVDAYTTWCGPCKWMAKNIFPVKEVGDVFNASFINAKIDMEKGEGVDIAKKYVIRAYPTYIFVNGDGEMVHRSLGSKPADKFIDDAKAAIDPNKQFFTLKKRFDNGDKNPEFLKNLSYSAEAAQDMELASKTSEAYMASQKDWSTPENMKFVLTFATSMEGKFFNYVLKNKAAFEKMSDKARVENLLIGVPMGDMSKKYYNRTTRLLDTEKSEAYLNQHLPKELTQQVMAYAALRMSSNKEESALMKQVIEYMDKYSSENPNFLNQYAWLFYEKASDPLMLQKALDWSLKSVKIDDNFAFNDTAAALYFKMANKKKAKEFAEKAIKKAKDNNEDAAETEALLKKIEAMQ